MMAKNGPTDASQATQQKVLLYVMPGMLALFGFQVAIGTHEMVFRHPQLGERRQSVTVTAKGPNRIAADLTK